MKSLLLICGWIVAALGLYFGMVGMEYYWNVPRWQPAMDLFGCIGLAWLAVMLLSLLLLSSVTTARPVKVVAWVLSGLLIGVGIYAAGPESNTVGLFERAEPSPLWYRVGRALLMAAPLPFLLLARRRNRPCGFAPELP